MSLGDHRAFLQCFSRLNRATVIVRAFQSCKSSYYNRVLQISSFQILPQLSCVLRYWFELSVVSFTWNRATFAELCWLKRGSNKSAIISEKSSNVFAAPKGSKWCFVYCVPWRWHIGGGISFCGICRGNRNYEKNMSGDSYRVKPDTTSDSVLNTCCHQT